MKASRACPLLVKRIKREAFITILPVNILTHLHACHYSSAFFVRLVKHTITSEQNSFHNETMQREKRQISKLSVSTPSVSLVPPHKSPCQSHGSFGHQGAHCSLWPSFTSESGTAGASDETPSFQKQKIWIVLKSDTKCVFSNSTSTLVSG